MLRLLPLIPEILNCISDPRDVWGKGFTLRTYCSKDVECERLGWILKDVIGRHGL